MKKNNPIQDLRALELKVSKQEIQTQNLLLQCVDFKKELESFLSNYNDLVKINYMHYIIYIHSNMLFFLRSI